jgi:hypothetical protein
VTGMRVAYGVAGMGSDVFGVLVVIAMVLTKVSDVCDEVVEMQNDCPKGSGGAREICHHVLHVHDPGLVLLQVCRYRARGLGSLSVFCLVLAQHSPSIARDVRW